MRSRHVTRANGLSDWFFSSLGRYVASVDQSYFDAEVADVFGYNAFQIGLPEHDLLRSNRMPLRCAMASSGGAPLLAEDQALPIRSGVADLVILPHALEFSDNPHEVLREVERILMPEGHVILSGFNPWSLWGARRFLSRRQADPWGGQFVSLARIKDWLALLGFEVTSGRMGCHLPPIANDKWRQRFAFMEKAGDRWIPFAGGVYFLHGIKRVQGMRLITPKWKSARARKRLVVLPQRRTRADDTLAARHADERRDA